MKYNIRGDKIKVTKAIKDYIEEKLDKLNKYYESPSEVECKALIRSKNNLQTIEVTVPLNKFILRAEVSEEDLYAAIDLVVDKLEGQIRKNKTKLQNRYDKSDKLDINFDFDPEAEEENDLKIVKRKDIDSKPMDEEEAILQMNLLNHDFFVFKNVDEECVSVIYKRKDQKYGIINVK